MIDKKIHNQCYYCGSNHKNHRDTSIYHNNVYFKYDNSSCDILQYNSIYSNTNLNNKMRLISNKTMKTSSCTSNNRNLNVKNDIMEIGYNGDSRKTNIVIFGGSNKPPFFDDLKNNLVNLANNIDIDKYDIWYGGGDSGLMGIIPKRFSDNGGYVYAINAKQFVDKYGIPPFIKKTIIKDTYDERQLELINKSDIVICLPGGVGTLSELFDTFVNNIYNNKNINIIIYNYNNYYNDIINFIYKNIETGLIKKELLNNVNIFNDISEIADYLKLYS